MVAFNRSLAAFALALFFMATGAARAADWPQFRGPHRDGLCDEKGLLKKWPDAGPKLLWSCEGLGEGHASLTVVKGIVYTTGRLESKDGYVFAIDPTGKIKWKQPYGPETDAKGHPGSRSTPTFDDGLLYAESGFGQLLCLDAATGAQKWTVSLKDKFKAQDISWSLCESPLIDGDRVICTPGGPEVTLAALDKKTGATIWTSKGMSDASGYCSPCLIERGGKRIILTMTADYVAAFDAGTGALLWNYQHSTKYKIHPNTPIYSNGMIYATAGYGSGGVMLELSEDGTKVTQKWTDKRLDSKHHGAVLADGYIYTSGDQGNKGMGCLELATGKLAWTESSLGRTSVIYADGMIYGYSEKGTMNLIKADPKAFELVSSFKIEKGTSENYWAHPAISDGRLYVRHGDTLMVYDIKESGK